MEQLTRNLMMRYKALHLRDDIDRLYVSRKGGRWLASIENSINTLIRWLEDFIKKKQSKVNYSEQKQHKQHKHQQNNNNQKTKIRRKTSVLIFQVTNRISQEKTWTGQRKGNFKKETDSFLTAAQSNIRTIYVKAKIDMLQQNSRWRLYNDRDETINHINECSKLGQKEHRHDWEGKVINWELCKKCKFGHTNKWYMDNPESILENDIAQTSQEFFYRNRSPNLYQMTRPSYSQQKEWEPAK